MTIWDAICTQHIDPRTATSQERKAVHEIRTRLIRERVAQNHQDRIAAKLERRTAQTARALWPTDDDQLHSKVERVQQALRTTGRSGDAERLTLAHSAAWRKQKRLLIQEHGRKPLPYEDGDMTRADWWGYAEDAAQAAEQTTRIAQQTLRFAETVGATSATLGLIDATYWAAKDTLDDLWEAQGAIPPSDAGLGLFTRLEDRADRLQAAKDELVSWADAHGHTITR